MLKRRLKTRSKLTRIISFASVKCGELRYCESNLERDRLLHLEFDPAVSFYEAQPDTFPYETDNGKRSEYTPDVKVYCGNESHIEEIKPDDVYRQQDAFAKYSAIKRMFLLEDTDYRIVTDLDVYIGETISNYLLLYRFLGEPLPHSLLDRFQTEFPSFQGSHVEMKMLLREKRFPPYAANMLLAQGYVLFDHLEPINDSLEVRTL